MGKKPSLKKKYFAAIDIGSNAIRMVIAEHSTSGLKMVKKYRFPIRLGADVFARGKISEQNLKLSAQTFRKFRELTKKYNIAEIRAVGTSALREAANQQVFIDRIFAKSRIEIEVIDGVDEARLIHLAVRHEVNLEDSDALLIDIGGGSVELTFSDHAMMTATQSFPFGTVRTLEMMKKRRIPESQLSIVIGDFLEPLTHFIQSHGPGHPLQFAVGTGGNLETIGRLKPLLLKSPSQTFVSFLELSQIIEKLQKASIKDRIERLGLRPDRADVIVPAALVIQTVMRQAGLEKLLIPQVGLKDGLLWSLVQDSYHLNKNLG
ncbi:MAG: hypothetical protein COT73_09485 [Bdellovibrio sp. CG10_big_fil_rev_8_21_14_0_10_47_8]|nr:MAG: hypothetical protein COT73_09485 [Bdellovibrio sp. CG10_big_fil_rev_8_21_14_0_10_47_8]